MILSLPREESTLPQTQTGFAPGHTGPRVRANPVPPFRRGGWPAVALSRVSTTTTRQDSLQCDFHPELSPQLSPESLSPMPRARVSLVITEGQKCLTSSEEVVATHQKLVFLLIHTMGCIPQFGSSVQDFQTQNVNWWNTYKP